MIDEEDFYWIKDAVTDAVLAGQLCASPNTFNIYEAGDRTGTSRKSNVLIELENIQGKVQGGRSFLQNILIRDDICETDEVTELAILWSLEQRFRKDQIYTNVGPILVAINPYKSVQNLYSQEELRRYHSTQVDDTKPVGTVQEFDDAKRCVDASLPPHVWRVAKGAISAMQSKNRNQAILASGESGLSSAIFIFFKMNCLI